MTPSAPKQKRAVTNRLWRYRTVQQLTQKDVAKHLGHRNTAQVSRWENGAKTPTLDSALRLSHILKAPVEALFADRASELHAEITSRASAMSGVGERMNHADKTRPKA